MLIGRVIFSWSLIENAMEDTIWHFLNISMDDGRVVTARLDAKHKLLILRGLGERYLDEAKDDFMIILNRMLDLYEERNFIAHGFWGTLIPDEIPAAASLKIKAYPTQEDPSDIITETFPEGRMHGIINRMCVIMEWLEELMGALAALHNRPFLPPLPTE